MRYINNNPLNKYIQTAHKLREMIKNLYRSHSENHDESSGVFIDILIKSIFEASKESYDTANYLNQDNISASLLSTIVG